MTDAYTRRSRTAISSKKNPVNLKYKGQLFIIDADMDKGTGDCPEAPEPCRKECEENSEANCLLDPEFMASILSVTKTIKEAERMRKAAMQAESLADKDQDVILHYVEKHEKIDAAKACKLIKLLGETRRRRRLAKNQFLVASELLRRFRAEDAQSLGNLIDGLERRTYTLKSDIPSRNGIEF